MRRCCWLALFVVAACGDGETDVEPPVTPPETSISAPAMLTLVEGEAKTFSITLANVPSDGATVNVSAIDPSVAMVTPSSLTFSLNQLKAEVTVTSSEDDDDVTNEMTDVVLSIDGGDERRVSTRVVDNDVQQIVVDATNVTVIESATTTFGVRLARQPSAPVTLNVWTDAPGVAAVSPATLTFAPASYNVAQTVTVTGVVDADLADETARVFVGEMPLVSNVFVDVQVTDDDVQALVIGSTNVPVTEGANGTFTVSLAFDPGFATTVQLQSSDPSAAVLDNTFLQFTSADYATPRTVTIMGPEDSDQLNESVTVSVSGAASGSVTVPVLDNDLLQVSSSTPINEGDTAPFDVRLADSPGAVGMTVTATVLSGDVTIAPGSLLITSGDYASAHSFAVTAAVDYSSATSHLATIRFSAPGQTPRDVTFAIANRFPREMNYASVLEENPNAGALGYLDFTLGIVNAWPADGRAVFSFPPGFDAAGAILLSSNFDGTASLLATTSTVTVTRSGGTVHTGPITLRIGNVRYPPVSGGYPIAVATQTSAADPIDLGTATAHMLPGQMSAVSATLGNTSPNATTTLTVSFTNFNPWPADGKLVIRFPLGFDVSGAAVATQSGVDGTLTVGVLDTYVFLTRSGGTSTPGNTPLSITLASIGNPPSAQATDHFRLVTRVAGTDFAIDEGVANGLVVGCPTTMTKSPWRGTNVAFGGDAWLSPSRITVESPGAAYINALDASDYLVADDFRFTVPTGATVTGIQFNVSHDTLGPNAVDSSVRIVKSAIGQSERASTAFWTAASASYGGATDLWGETWTVADIESVSFGLAVAAKAAVLGMPPSYVGITDITATVHLSCP